MSKGRVLLLYAILVVSPKIFAAACCGSTANIPSLISGDDRAQVSAAFSYSQVKGDAAPDGTYIPRYSDDNETLQTVRLDGAILLSDRWQAGLTLPFSKRVRSRALGEAVASGVGDLAANVAFEWLPNWEYSVWKPKGFVYTQMLFPTGGSIYDAQELYRVDARGRGFYAASIGTVFLKNWKSFDAIFFAEFRKSFSRQFGGESAAYRVTPSWGASAGLGFGFSPGGGNLRFGAQLQPSYEGEMRLEGIASSVNPPQWVWNTALQASYLFSPEWSLNATFSDPTLLGGSRNSPLSQSLALLLQHRLPR